MVDTGIGRRVEEAAGADTAVVGRVAEGGSCGGYVTSLLLSAESLGIAAVPQAAIAMYPDIIRRELGLGEERKIVCGVAFGYRDTGHPVNSFRTTRADIADVVEWYS
ncbi:nitroreductase [Corynebacterium hylobatis]|uniref:Nitroreductase n=1 Tax=Corynebacterium hylobatis TaxID=1859290 RepID=A0A3S0BFD6_9CORY|nr:nitroreductase family protein [Corynebacterium hylobatis]RSZ61907.1 nitroreductase [Corynebacterium hylobatis]